MSDADQPPQDPAVRALYVQMQNLLVGHPMSRVVQALADSTASCIGLFADDLPAADKFVDDLGNDLKQTIRKNWDYLRQMRALTQQPPAGSA